MSVKLLSQAIADGEALDLPAGNELPDVVPGELRRNDGFSDSKFDAAFEAAAAKLPDFDAEEKPKGPRKSLDQLISEGLDKHYKLEQDKKDFYEARDTRHELTDRYSRLGDTANLENALTATLAWFDAFKRDPQAAGRAFADSYLKAGSEF